MAIPAEGWIETSAGALHSDLYSNSTLAVHTWVRGVLPYNTATVSAAAAGFVLQDGAASHVSVGWHISAGSQNTPDSHCAINGTVHQLGVMRLSRIDAQSADGSTRYLISASLVQPDTCDGAGAHEVCLSTPSSSSSSPQPWMELEFQPLAKDSAQWQQDSNIGIFEWHHRQVWGSFSGRLGDDIHVDAVPGWLLWHRARW